jgi:sporulation protein YlmC with PRC-barrel domain
MVSGSSVINADKVEGTAVYDPKGDKLGTIDDLVIDKVSGKTLYAIMSFGGFLGMGEKQHPLPWSTLNYDTGLEGYVVNLDKDMLEGAPSYDRGSDIDWTPEYGQRVNKYWKVEGEWP